MRKFFLLATLGAVCASNPLNAQLGKLKIPKEIPKEIPKVNGNGNNSGNSGNSGASTQTKVGLGGSDESGLFTNIGTDVSAGVHRQAAVENLKNIETELAKPAPNYPNLSKSIKDTDQRLGFVQKIEPNCNQTKFSDKYKPLKEQSEKELTAYNRLEELSEIFNRDFHAPTEANKTPFNQNFECYCQSRYSRKPRPYSEYPTLKAEYEQQQKVARGYKNEKTDKFFVDMVTCQKNANAYAVWASTDNLKVEVVDFSAQKQTSAPKEVIAKCEKYLKRLELIINDNSASYEAATQSAFSEGKTNIAKVKSEAELYISSGKYQAYLDKEHKAAIAKVTIPKANNKNATLEKGATDYVKGEEFAEYIKTGAGEIATVSRCVMLTKDTKIAKNDIGIPKYEFHEFVVGFKSKDGKCYKATVYASFTYKGGGVYSKEPTYGADYPEEMACENMNK